MVRLPNTCNFVVTMILTPILICSLKKHGRLHVIVLLYVDDMIVTCNDDGEIAKLQGELSILFEMKDLGDFSHFLWLGGETIERWSICVTKRLYGKSYIQLWFEPK